MSLSVREKIKESVKKGGLSNDELHHPSRAYERHFEGYLETPQEIPGRKRSKSVRTYVDSFWIQNLPSKQRIGYRILFVILFLLSLPPFLYSTTRPIDANTLWFVTLPQALSLFALAWSALCLYRYCTAPQKMTVRQYRQAVMHFHHSSCTAWVALAFLTISYLILALNTSVDCTQALLCALLCLSSCLCVLAVFLAEHRVKYTEHENPLAQK